MLRAASAPHSRPPETIVRTVDGETESPPEPPSRRIRGEEEVALKGELSANVRPRQGRASGPKKIPPSKISAYVLLVYGFPQFFDRLFGVGQKKVHCFVILS